MSLLFWKRAEPNNNAEGALPVDEQHALPVSLFIRGQDNIDAEAVGGPVKLPVDLSGATVLTNHASTEKMVNIANVITSGVAVLRAAGTLTAQMNLLKQYDVAVFVCTLTAAATEVGDSLDVYVDLSIDGFTWFNGIHFTQMLGNGGAKTFVAQLTHPTAAVADINVTADAAANAVRNLWAPHVRVGYVVVDAVTTSNAIFSFRVDCYLQAK